MAKCAVDLEAPSLRRRGLRLSVFRGRIRTNNHARIVAQSLNHEAGTEFHLRQRHHNCRNAELDVPQAENPFLSWIFANDKLNKLFHSKLKTRLERKRNHPRRAR